MLQRPRDTISTLTYCGLVLAAAFGTAGAGAALAAGSDRRLESGRMASPTFALPSAMGTCGASSPGSKVPAAAIKNNPDAAKQSGPLLGMPILLDMKKKPGSG